MSKRNTTFVAVTRVSSEYETYYGVVSLRRGDFLKWKEVTDFIQFITPKWAGLSEVSFYDSAMLWFEDIPWAAMPEGLTEEQTQEILLKRADIVDQLYDGGWVEMAEEALNDESAPCVRTTVDKAHLHDKAVYFSFYEKHGDHRYETDWLTLDRLAEHFAEEE